MTQSKLDKIKNEQYYMRKTGNIFLKNYLINNYIGMNLFNDENGDEFIQLRIKEIVLFTFQVLSTPNKWIQ